MDSVQLLAGYSFLGGAMKYIDMAYDDNVFSKRAGFCLAVASGVVMGGMIVADLNAAPILLSVVIGVALAGKIDNMAFATATAIVAGMSFAGFVSAGPYALLAIVAPTVMLVATAVVDEITNDLADRRVLRGTVGRFFHYRPAMKGSVLALVLLGFFGWVYFISFMLFDGAYALVETLENRG